ncbi:MAG TPA: GyrI-like domain-containing protein [Gaiellaceae bacterium]|nr:GyrI-like domain-containing protein [Gaiellaceae bacterium]
MSLGLDVRIDTVTRDELPVVSAAEPGTPDDIGGAARRAFERLESAIPVHGRKAYGLWDPFSCSYHACYALVEDDRPEDHGLEREVIPGGRYRRARLKGAEDVTRIGATFQALAKDEALDSERPWIEFYRRHDEVDLHVPIRAEPGATG